MEENKVIRVAQIIGHACDGGVESVIMNYYRHIDRSKVQFDFFVDGTSNIINKKEIESMGGRVTIIPYIKHYFKCMKALKKAFKENHYDIVHSNMNTLSVFYLRMAKKCGIKVRIAHSHTTSNKKEHLRNFIKNVLKLFSKTYATHYFACSELAGRYMFGDKAYARGQVIIIQNGIEIEKFRFSEDNRNLIRKKLGIDDDTFVIGHVGRFVEQKNHTFLVKIFYEVLKDRSNSKLLLIGDGPLKEDIIKKCEDLNISNKVIFLGTTSEINMYYSAMDCFLFTSLYEGLGMVLIEAQINGLYCVASKNVPPNVDISNNVLFLSLNERVNIWAETIISGRRKEIRFAHNFDINFNAISMLDIYKSTVEVFKK
ncbi:MAG: glycosyltransferase family 1 protein [Bacilli bacterium]|nr:glycosyltransferase family 1 protein [Bacilli bacterium]